MDVRYSQGEPLSMSDAEQPTPLPAQSTVPNEIIVEAKDLLRGQREIIVVHEGVRYRLRLTRRNKLILQK